MAAIDIVDRRAFLDVHHEGELLYKVTTERPQAPRWIEIALYRLDDGGPGQYLVHRNGVSLLYHRSGDGCQTAFGRPSGYPAVLADLPEDAVACPRCHPPSLAELAAAPLTPVRYEFDRPTVDICVSAAQVVDRLTTPASKSRGTERTVSAPVIELLNEAAAVDEGFAFAAAQRSA